MGVKNVSYRFGVPVAVCLSLMSGQAYAEGGISDNYLGLSFATGATDVVDWYESTLPVTTTWLSGIGLSYRYAYTFDYGLRLDAGLGPMFFVMGDVDYYDIPLNATVGYTFPTGNVKPYVRGGLSYHFIDGDYVSDSDSVGFLGGVGVKFNFDGRENFGMFAEVTHDTAKVEFSEAEVPTYLRNNKGNPETESMKAQNLIFTIGAIF